MAYPSLSFKPTSAILGLQPIAETSTVKRHNIGMTVTAFDFTYGEATFIYLVGVASTAAGDLVCYDAKNGDTARAVHNGATSFGPCAVAMSDNVASQYGWYMVVGAGPVASATVLADAPLFLTSTAGTVDDAVVSGDLINGISSRSASSGGFTTCQLAWPSVDAVSGGSTLSTLRSDLDATIIVANAAATATAAATKASILKITLSAAVEAGDAIVVSGVVEDLAGLDASAAKQVLVRSLASTPDKGDITVTVGTDKKTVNPATGENVSWIETTAAGLFAVSIANNQAEANLVQVTTETGVSALLKLTFT